MNVYTLTDEERKWLTDLDKDLWPPPPPPEGFPQKKQITIKLEARRTLKVGEFQEVLKLIKDRRLVTQMFCTSMFGGYGMDVFEHEPCPGAGAIHLLRLVEDHIPKPTASQVKKGHDKHLRKVPGVGRDDAWESFSAFTHSKQNVEWLKHYKMTLPESRGSYDY